MTAIPKPQPPARSKAYLAFVRTHPCISCGKEGPSEADHVGPRGVGQKTSDYRCVPLCSACHRWRTDNDYLPVQVPGNGHLVIPLHRATNGYAEDAKRHTRLIVAEAQRELLVEWLTRKEA
jgi:hypothetical protein